MWLDGSETKRGTLSRSSRLHLLYPNEMVMSSYQGHLSVWAACQEEHVYLRKEEQPGVRRHRIVRHSWYGNHIWETLTTQDAWRFAREKRSPYIFFVAVSCACAWTSRAEQSPREHISPQVEVAWCSSGPCPEVLQTVDLSKYLVCFVWKARRSQLRNDYNWSLKSKDPISKI